LPLTAYPALLHHGFSFEDIASPAVFARDPHLAWGFYRHRLALYRATEPHAGFQILRDWAARMAHGAFVFTSNVDGQFEKAGFADARIEAHHGSIHALQCAEACTDDAWPAAGFEPQVDEARCRLLGELPRCPHGGARARPNILMFGDYHWVECFARAGRTPPALARRSDAAGGGELGAGTALPTVRRFSERHAPRVIRINPREAQIDPAHGVGIALGALAGLQAIDARLRAA
jgi:hypothetical protein